MCKTFPYSFSGIILALIPSFIILVIISIFVGGNFLNYKFSFFNC